ncbi:MAG TPA: phosphate ABC transporter substrate-binding protein PstS [Solirubrobacterales bacterium]|nr:phosphate ABC transporter substrate-binding protein PstS [Solirubrobacterales bacterium]
MTKRLLSVGMALALTIAVAACGSSSSSTSSSSGGSSSSPLVGAGSTLVAPLMSKWQSDYASKTKETVTYGAIGSGGGIAQITSRTVDFGASDAPLTSEQFKEANGVEQIPWALSGTVPAYNVKGAPKNLKLNGEVLAGIYLGKITAWNDPAIAKLNPGASLPSTKITPVYRSDGSGDTYAFTNYLSTVSPEFKSKVGASTTVKFPTGVGAEKNDGVAAAISQTDGAIGYVGLAYALSNELSMPLVENSAGSFPVPGVKSVTAAAAAVSKIGPNNEISLAGLPSTAKGAYPISTYTYVIVPLKTEKADALKKFITYAIGPAAQEFGPDLDFAPLPAQVVAADKKAIAKIGG